MALDAYDLLVKIGLDSSGYEKGLSGIKGSLGNFGSSFDKATNAGTNAIQKLMTKSQVIGNAITGIFSKVGGVISSSMDGAAARVDTLNSYTRVMKGLGYSTDDADAAIQKLSDGIQGLPTTLPGIASIQQQFTALMGDLDKSTDLTLALNDAVLAGGQGQEIANSALNQWYQMIANGKPDMQSWRIVNSAMPAQLKAVAQECLGASASSQQLFDAWKNGKVTTEQVEEAIEKLDKDGGKGIKSFAEQAQDANGGIQTSLQNVKTKIVTVMGNIIQTMTENGLSISGILDHVKSDIGDLGSHFQDVAKQIDWKTISDNVTNLIDSTFSLIESIDWEGIINTIARLGQVVSDVASTIFDMVDKIRNGLDVSSDIDSIVEKLTGVFTAITDKIAEVLPKVITIGTQIITGLIQSISKNADKLMNGAAEIIKALADGIIKNLPLIADAASDLIKAFSKYITEHRNEIQGGIKDLVNAIVQGIVTLAPSLAEAALTLVSALGGALIDSIPEIVKQLPKFVADLFGAIGDALKNSDAEGRAAIIAVLAPILTGGIKGAVDKVKSAKDIVGKGADIFSALFGKGKAASKAKKTFDKGADFLGIGQDWADALPDAELSGFDKIKSAISKISLGKGDADKATEAVEGTSKIGAATSKLGSLKVPDVKTVLKGLADIAIIIGGVTAVITATGAVLSIGSLSEFLESGIDSLTKVFTGLANIALPLGVTGAAIIAMGSMVSPTTTVKGLADMAIIIGGVEAVITATGALLSIGDLGTFLSTGINSLVSVFTGLDQVMAPLAEFSALLVGLGIANPGTILSGLSGFTLIVGGLEGLLAALGGISQIPGFDWIVNEGGQALIKLGEVIGGFAGSLVEGAITEVSSGLPEVGKNLADFMTNATPFFTGLSNVNEDAVTAVESLAKAILIITATDVLDGLTSWLTGGSSFVDFGKQLAEFGPYMKQYADSVSGMDTSAVSASANAAKSLADMADSIPNSGGLASLFAGDNNIDEWGAKLPTFGEYMKKYGDSVSGIDTSAIQSSATAAKSLSDMASNIPNSGGLVSLFTGDNDINTWGAKLPTFGGYMKQFSDAVAGINTGAMNSSVNAAKSLVSVADTVSQLSGKGDLNKWGGKIVKFGKNLSSYSSEVSKLNFGNIRESASAFRTLVSASSAISADGNKGVASTIKGYFDKMVDALKSASNDLGSQLDTMKSTLNTKAQAVGKALADGVWVGLNGQKASLYSRVAAFFNGIVSTAKKTMDIHSPSRVMRDQVGVQLAAGVAKGIEKGTPKATKASDAMAKKIYNSIDKSITKGSGKNKKTIKKSNSEIEKEYIKATEKRIKELKNAGKLTEKQEAQLWKSVLKHVRKGTDAYGTALQKLSKLSKQSAQDRLNAYEKAVDNYSALHNGAELTLADEVAFWKKATKTFKKGSDEWITARKNYLSAKQSLDEKEKQANEDLNNSLAEAEKTYQDALQATLDKIETKKQSILSGLGDWFSVFDEGDPASFSAMDAAIDSQLNALNLWDKLLDELGAKIGTDSDLYKEIEGMGATQGMAYLKALLSAPDDELQKYSAKFSERINRAGEIAQKELAPEIKEDSQKAWDTYLSSVEEAMDTYKEAMADCGVEVENFTELVSGHVENAKEAYGTFVQSLSDGSKEGMDDVTANVNNGFNKAISKAGVSGSDMMGSFIAGINSRMGELQSTLAGMGGLVAGYIGFSEPDMGPLSNFHTFAPDMMDLFSQGIKDNGHLVGEAFDEALGLNTPNLEESLGAITVQNPNAITQGGDIGNAILNTLRQYLPQLGNQQIILDSGQLVGATANRMNEELAYVNGRRAGAFA